MFGNDRNNVSAKTVRLWGSAFFASAKKADGKKAALRDRLCGGGPLGILLRVGVFALKMRKNSSPLSVYGKSASICASRTRRTSWGDRHPIFLHTASYFSRRASMVHRQMGLSTVVILQKSFDYRNITTVARPMEWGGKCLFLKQLRTEGSTAGKCSVTEVRRVRHAHVETDFRKTIMGPRIFAS